MKQHDVFIPAKVVSGGQTGVDRAALDIALELGIPTGGWCPAGKRAQDGRIADRYYLKETESSDYKVRTKMNVRDSDATLIIYFKTLTGGSALTAKFAEALGRSFLAVEIGSKRSLERTRQWLAETCPDTLNIAGPRNNMQGNIYRKTNQFLRALFTR